MISTSAQYQAAIVGSPRRIEILATVDIVSPDLTYGTVSADSLAPWSKPEQLHDKKFGPPARYSTLELNRWGLDGSFSLFPSNFSVDAELGAANNRLCGEDGTFSPAAWMEQPISGADILQMCSVFFSSDPADGIPVDFTVDVYSGDTSYFTKTFTGNRATEVAVTGFTVYSPTAIRVTCTKWSLPFRRLRIMEIYPGLYEEWTNRALAAFSCTQQGDFSCLSLPYGSVSLSMDNADRRFEPRRKDSIFQSIEERQGIDIHIGVRLKNGAWERVKLGVFYQAGDGWKTSENALTIDWYLVDIIGLLSDRTFLPPEALPETLAGWLEAIAAQLGENFRDRWSCDPNYADKPVIANSAEDVTDKNCGDMIRWVCQAAGTWPRADSETGYLTAEPLWSQGNKLTLDNLTKYPVMKANQSLAALIFTLTDGSQYVVSGNSTSAKNTVTIQNPFLHTRAQALDAAKLILAQYGGNVLETVGRGDPSSEIGDVDTVWLDEGNAVTARRKSQTIQFSEGVMRDCRSTLLQSAGVFLFEGRAVLTGAGEWTAPAGAAQLRLFLVGQGSNGTASTAGSFSSEGTPGQDGAGGLVWAGVININPQQTFAYSVTQTAVFGAYSSANGKRYPNGYTDLASGSSYARSGVKYPIPGSGDGGAGGEAGTKGYRHTETRYHTDEFGNKYPYEVTVEDARPGPAKPGTPGAIGCIVVYWDKGGQP